MQAPDDLAGWRALLEILAILSTAATAAAAWCLHRVRQPLLRLASSLEAHHAKLEQHGQRLENHAIRLEAVEERAAFLLERLP